MASLLHLLLLCVTVSQRPLCSERCGQTPIPFPFHLSPSCGLGSIPFFNLSCPPNSSLPLLFLLPTPLPILSFIPSSSALILDHPGSSSILLPASPFLSLSSRNLLRLFDCEDSSVCRSECEEINGGAGYGCCYPLSDGSVWKPGDGFEVFADFGCRGFSSWVLTGYEENGTAVARRGIEVEWAVPRRYGNDTVCAEGAAAVNSTAVEGGFKCVCEDGLVGDGFAQGVGCSKSSTEDEHISNDRDRCEGRLCYKKVVILVGVVVFGLLAAAVVVCFPVRKPSKANNWDFYPVCLPKTCGMRLFSYQELNDATKGFEDRKLVAVHDGTVFTGVLDDGSSVAVQKVQCETQLDLSQVLARVEHFSQISHKNIARIVGCGFQGNVLLLAHEFSSYRRSVEELLQEDKNNVLDWYTRINIATEVASALTYLQCEISPPIYLHNIRSSDIFIGVDYSIKIVLYKFLNSGVGDGSCSYEVPHDSHVVYDFGLILLVLITGSKHGDLLEVVVPKISERKVHEIVDPYIGYSEGLNVQSDQIERVAGLAVHCLSSENKELGMVGVAKELVSILNENVGSSSRTRPALEVTFSNSSLLQMISVSPDSLHVP